MDDGWTYVRTPIGRRRLLSYDDATMSDANTLIQGAGADILKIAIANLGKHVNQKLDLATVHDEQLEALEEKAEEYKLILETEMERIFVGSP